MRKGLLSGVFVMVSLCSFAQGAGYEERAKSYIEQYKYLAVAEQKRSGIPAAITLAQGIHAVSYTHLDVYKRQAGMCGVHHEFIAS